MDANQKSLSELQHAAAAILRKGVTNKATLLEALPLLIELENAATATFRHASACLKVVRSLSEDCTAYVTDHPSVLEEGTFVENQNGVLTGDVFIEDTDYHLACGYDGYMRTEKAAMDQKFLSRLPKGWTKARLEISTTGINASRPTEEALAAAGLQPRPKNVWSVKAE